MKLAKRMSRLGTETAFEALAAARALEAEGKSIIHLGIGEPDFDTPIHIREAAKSALDDGYTHYTPSPGLMDVREAVALHQSNSQGYPVSPENIVITPGGKPVMFFTILALIENGDEVIYPNPGFPIYESMINFAGGTAIPWQLKEENDFSADVDSLVHLVSNKTKLIIINSPNNPCGSVMPPEDIERVAKIAKDANVFVLSDEIYKDFYFEGQHVSISQFEGMRDRTIILDGLSKGYAMTGWRVGYGVFPNALVEPISRLMTNSVSCTAAFSQIAAAAALNSNQEDAQAMVKEFKSRRDIMVSGLNSLPGITCNNPKGAFYAFPNITNTGMSSSDFEKRMLNDAGVSLLSGTAFGVMGEGYIRVTFANSRENLNEALKRMKEFLK
ncbi:MAG: aspartate aminotransferase [Chloroflexi bacterium]|nr:aspartate aminotransferase [Chloroflexota bacterium]MBT17464.1 aspartate aminotransferase [Dehalococcoidia bacterium]|tara:strand:- start:2090 stop:3247 length:1158 start_codon:yes stop_codon:yes gene_type:complete